MSEFRVITGKNGYGKDNEKLIPVTPINYVQFYGLYLLMGGGT